MTARTIEVAVEDAWIDYNGHLNDAAYAIIASRVHDQVLDDLGMGETASRAGEPTGFTVRQVIEHTAEIPPGSRVQAEPAVTRLGRTSLTLRSTLRVDGSPRAEAEMVIVRVGQDGSTVPLTDEIRSRAARWPAPE